MSEPPSQQPQSPPPYPDGGFTVPSPYQTAKRIPDGLPFTIRPSIGRVLLWQGGVMAIVLLPIVCCFAVGVSNTNGMSSEDATQLLLIASIPLLFALLMVGFMVYVATSGGPTLAADEHGVWIRARKWPVKAIWLPWEAIARVYTRRWGIDKAVCIQPHDPRAGSGTGMWSAVDQGMAQVLLGSKFNASTVFGDKREPEIMAAMAHFARGRTYIG